MPGPPQPVKLFQGNERSIMFYHLPYNWEQLPSSHEWYDDDEEAPLLNIKSISVEVSMVRSFENVEMHQFKCSLRVIVWFTDWLCLCIGTFVCRVGAKRAFKDIHIEEICIWSQSHDTESQSWILSWQFTFTSITAVFLFHMLFLKCRVIFFVSLWCMSKNGQVFMGLGIDGHSSDTLISFPMRK